MADGTIGMYDRVWVKFPIQKFSVSGTYQTEWIRVSRRPVNDVKMWAKSLRETITLKTIDNECFFQGNLLLNHLSQWNLLVRRGSINPCEIISRKIYINFMKNNEAIKRIGVLSVSLRVQV